MIVLVSGLFRSGTSMMIQMLRAGGLPVHADDRQRPDEHNPKGYWQVYHLGRKIRRDPTWLDRAEGGAIKVLFPGLYRIPGDRDYQVILMRREPAEIAESQTRMFGVLRKSPEIRVMQEDYITWAEEQFSSMIMDYADMLVDSAKEAKRIAEFLGNGLDSVAMSRAVDPVLYRSRGTCEPNLANVAARRKACVACDRRDCFLKRLLNDKCQRAFRARIVLPGMVCPLERWT